MKIITTQIAILSSLLILGSIKRILTARENKTYNFKVRTAEFFNHDDHYCKVTGGQFEYNTEKNYISFTGTLSGENQAVLKKVGDAYQFPIRDIFFNTWNNYSQSTWHFIGVGTYDNIEAGFCEAGKGAECQEKGSPGLRIFLEDTSEDDRQGVIDALRTNGEVMNSDNESQVGTIDNLNASRVTTNEILVDLKTNSTSTEQKKTALEAKKKNATDSKAAAEKSLDTELASEANLKKEIVVTQGSLHDLSLELQILGEELNALEKSETKINDLIKDETTKKTTSLTDCGTNIDALIKLSQPLLPADEKKLTDMKKECSNLSANSFKFLF